MTITDTHTHLYSNEFDEDRDEMIQRAIDAGVSRFFIPPSILLTHNRCTIWKSLTPTIFF